MRTISIELPEKVLVSTGLTREDFIREAKLLLALKLFELGRLSSGQAAELCDLERIDFIFAAGRMCIPVADLDEEEVEQEFAE